MDACRRTLSPAAPALDGQTPVAATACASAVSAFRVALETAEANARMKKDKPLSLGARASLRRARLLWSPAKNSSALPEERTRAYERVRAELTRHLDLPEEALGELTARQGVLALTAG